MVPDESGGNKGGMHGGADEADLIMPLPNVPRDNSRDYSESIVHNDTNLLSTAFNMHPHDDALPQTHQGFTVGTSMATKLPQNASSTQEGFQPTGGQFCANR